MRYGLQGGNKPLWESKEGGIQLEKNKREEKEENIEGGRESETGREGENQREGEKHIYIRAKTEGYFLFLIN